MSSIKNTNELPHNHGRIAQYEEHEKHITAESYREISLQLFTDREGMRRYQTCWLKYGP
jgi:hypothetical protein